MPLKDNSTFADKVRLRRRVLQECPAPVVLESNGGYGRLYERTWFKAKFGVVLEKDDRKVEHLAAQRPTWAVYQADCVAVIEDGLFKGTAFDVVDLDPWGMTLPLVNALGATPRVYPDRWHLVANDGGWQMISRGGAWRIKAMSAAVKKYGTFFTRDTYESALLEHIQEFAEVIGFKVAKWSLTWHGGHNMMVHYWAVLERK